MFNLCNFIIVISINSTVIIIKIMHRNIINIANILLNDKHDQISENSEKKDCTTNNNTITVQCQPALVLAEIFKPIIIIAPNNNNNNNSNNNIDNIECVKKVELYSKWYNLDKTIFFGLIKHKPNIPLRKDTLNKVR